MGDETQQNIEEIVNEYGGINKNVLRAKLELLVVIAERDELKRCSELTIE